MKTSLILSSSFVALFIISAACFSQDDVVAKVQPSAINARIEEHRMGEIVVTTKPGANVEIKQLRHEFKFGKAICDKNRLFSIVELDSRWPKIGRIKLKPKTGAT